MQHIRNLFLSLTVTLILSPLASGCQARKGVEAETTPGNGYKITLEMKDMKDSLVILGNYWADRTVAFDTAYYNSKRKNWVFEGNEKAPRGIYFLIFKDRSVLEFVMNDNQVFTLQGDSQDNYVTNLHAIGNDENERYADYKRKAMYYGKSIFDLTKKIDATTDTKEKQKLVDNRTDLYKGRLEYMTSFIADYPNDLFAKFITALKPIDVPDLKKENGNIDTQGQYYFYKNHFWDNFSFTEGGLVRTPENMIYEKIQSYFTNVVPQHPDTVIAYADALLAKTNGTRELDKYFIFRIAQLYDTLQLMCMDKVFVHMVDKYYLGGRAFWADSATLARMKEAADKRRYTNCGAVALDLNYYDLDSVPQRLYTNLGKKYTILVFYDPTCGHCKKELPILHNLYEKHKADGWSVYAISTMNKKPEWRKYILEENPTWTDWTNVCDVVPYQNWVDNRERYNITSNPTIMVLDGDGKILAKKIPAENIEPFLEQYTKVMNKQ